MLEIRVVERTSNRSHMKFQCHFTK